MKNKRNQQSAKAPPVRILHVEDNPHDRALIAARLLAEGLNCEIRCVTTEKELREALDESEFDLILSDYTLPCFSGAAALEVVKALRPEIPFLFVSGTIGTERALEALKEGATDYVLKDHLERLGAAVRRALREAQERTEHLHAEQRIRRLNRTYIVLSAINQLIVRGVEPQGLLDGACRIAVEQGGFRMAWIGMPDAAMRILKPMASAGIVEGYLDTLEIDLQDAAHNTGPSARALLTGKYLICNDIACDPIMAPWREAALQRGYRARAAFPLNVAGKTVGTFNLYAGETYLFDAEELRLLDELAQNIAFALESCEREQQRQSALEQLRASEERFRELAETVQEVFWVIDPARSKNRVLYISPGYERIWGRSCQSLYDNPASWLDAIHPEDRDRVRQAAATQQTGGAYNEVYRIIRPDSQIRWIRDVAFPVRNAAGEVERVVGAARDVTERRQLEDQLRQSQKMEAIGLLAGGVAHDFNNILAAIMLQAELSAGSENISKEAHDGFEQIRIATEHGASLINQLLLFSRKQVMQARNLDLSEIVTNLAKMLQRFIGEDIQLQLHLHSAPLITHADAGMLDQVLMNLAVNARDAMTLGGTLLIETGEKTVDEDFSRLNPDARPGEYVYLSARDTGAGIPPEVLPRIFEPFFTTKEPGKGTGLGLATVFGIVKQHRGFLGVESEPGKGTNFQIFLPASKVPAESSAPPAKLKPQGGSETIFLVEDEQAVRHVTRAVLEHHGYRVLEACDGVEAIKLWEEHREHVALLLIDLVLPGGLSGQEVARRLQKDKPDLRIIYVSGYSAEIAGRQIELKSGENFLQKPSSTYQLMETIRRSLDG